MPVVSVIIPAHNVEKTLETVVRQTVNQLKKLNQSYELIIAEDGSSDGTLEIAKKMLKEYKNLKLFHSVRRLGKGGALTSSFQRVSGNKRIFIDADYVDVPEFLPLMIKQLDKCDIVIVSRYKKISKTRRLFRRFIVSKGYIMLAKLFFFLPFSDLQCGFKGLNKKVVPILKKVKSKDYFWDTEFLIKARATGHTICEVPVSWIESKSKSSASVISYSFKFIKSLIKLRIGLL